MTSNHPQQLVQKLWNYCNILRDDGLSYGDYVGQLTFLLFLKMAEEQRQPPFNKPSSVPKGFDWPSLMSKDGDELETHYRHVLETLGKRSGMLGVIFRKAQNKIQDPAKLRRLIVDLIDKEQWSSLSAARTAQQDGAGSDIRVGDVHKADTAAADADDAVGDQQLRRGVTNHRSADRFPRATEQHRV